MGPSSESERLVAWSDELSRVHTRLRAALRICREAIDDGADSGAATRDLLLYCHGFCAALGNHHLGEDHTLFPAIAAAHPELQPVLRSLEQDHSMIAHLLGGMRTAIDHAATPDELSRHLDGIGAIMESHFRYEEKQLLTVLETLDLAADPTRALGAI